MTLRAMGGSDYRGSPGRIVERTPAHSSRRDGSARTGSSRPSAWLPVSSGMRFCRWRELYRSASWMRDDARRLMDAPRATRPEREGAEQREREARRQLALLRNETTRYEESDFYPYRYLATEGFLPGYNFPRLPVRALLSVREIRARSLDRPRFLGLQEFGPHNLIYHEGRRHQVIWRLYAAGRVRRNFANRRGRVRRLRVHPYRSVPARRAVRALWPPAHRRQL